MNKVIHWIRDYNGIILAFTLAKLLPTCLQPPTYGLQRDAYLYLAQSNHLDWGYFSTPPLLAFVTSIHTFIWGDSLLAVRLLPALIGAVSIFIVGWLIRQLKGGTLAQLIGAHCLPALPCLSATGRAASTGHLQPLFWLLAAVVIFQLVRKQDPRLLLWMIPVLGLGWLNKYSILFYGSALLAAMILSRHRKLLWSRYLPLTLAGGLLLILPNLVWQYQHNWPVISHMHELQETQLGNVTAKGFPAGTDLHAHAGSARLAGRL